MTHQYKSTAESDWRKKIIEENTATRLSLIPHKKFERILDLGCSDGVLSKRIQEMTKSPLVGVDNYAGRYELAKQKGIEVVDADLNQKLPFDDNSFDLVFAGELIEHVLSPDELLQEVQRVLKPNGLFVLTTPNLAAWHNRLLLLFGLMPYGPEVSTKNAQIGLGPLVRIKNPEPAGHIRVFTLRALKDMLTMYGFSIDAVKGCPTDYFPYPFRYVEKLIALVPSLASGLVVRTISKK